MNCVGLSKDKDKIVGFHARAPARSTAKPKAGNYMHICHQIG